MNDYEEYEDILQDSHAKARDKKLHHRSIDKMMRGNRSVFTMRDEKRKRDKEVAERQD